MLGDEINHFITFKDYLLLPIYLIVAINLFNRYCEEHYPVGHPWRNHFKNAYKLKLIGAILIGLIYEYYYHGGDSSTYFWHAKEVWRIFWKNPFHGINIILGIASPEDSQYANYFTKMIWYDGGSAWFVSAFTSVLNLFALNTYLPCAVLFASVTFSGSWALFRTFATKYPQITKYIAIATLYLPSLVIWGSGIFKDTLCIFGLGWLTYTSVNIFIDKKFSLKNVFLMLLSAIIVIKIKLYIFVAFAPALMLWIFLVYAHSIKNALLKWILTLTVIAGSVGGFLIFTTVFAEEMGAYSLENIAKTSETTRDWITYASYMNGGDGSTYDLGEFDPTPMGMLKKFPQAVVVTLFRPFLWESRKPMVLINAIEMFLYLFYTLKVLIAVGPFKFFSTILKDPNIMFFLIFSLIFAFAVGLSSYNFGALSRYRIPCLPFYSLMLIFIYYRNKPVTKNFLSFKIE